MGQVEPVADSAIATAKLKFQNTNERVLEIEQDYGTMTHIWSIGCIFAELLGMLQQNCPTPMDRAPLFQRDIYLLSPIRHQKGTSQPALYSRL